MRNIFITKRRVVIVSFCLIAVLFLALGINYIMSTHVLHIETKNVASFEIYKGEIGGSSTLVKKVATETTTSTRVANGSAYYISYKGSAGYANGSVTVSGSSVAIDPDYSAQHISTLLAIEKQATTAAITKSDPAIPSVYTIGGGTLFSKGKYYVTTLTPLAESGDMYVVALEKSDNTWKVVVQPTIIITKDSKPATVSTDLVVFVNNYRQAEAQKLISK